MQDAFPHNVCLLTATPRPTRLCAARGPPPPRPCRRPPVSHGCRRRARCFRYQCVSANKVRSDILRACEPPAVFAKRSTQCTALHFIPGAALSPHDAGCQHSFARHSLEVPLNPKADQALPGYQTLLKIIFGALSIETCQVVQSWHGQGGNRLCRSGKFATVVD